ncbi:MAG: hypothetical protein DSM107014_05715 [Gomphosphaeria aponina SAG 52.96 = DSM 107014]|uniref:Uncharacterized protein n=1 Tax=Gomphosphaeria aponina SAG 52.96 = DSM 107014 TaxID=1521640 RepID=A0A941GPC6_9CHRO|nr:hypothetical protein [Gomphosphaeria aponina SAG 52.96 = DSM 107014]
MIDLRFILTNRSPRGRFGPHYLDRERLIALSSLIAHNDHQLSTINYQLSIIERD